MKKTWIRLVSLLIVTLLALTGIATAEDAGTAEVVFSATEKADDIIELDLTVKNATFKILQMAVRYDDSVVMPVDESGIGTTNFDGFATRNEETSVFSEAGFGLDADKGLFGFTLFLMPNARGEGINENNEFEADGDGVNLFKFRFKRINTGTPSFEIAFEDDKKPYQPALKEGLILLGSEKQYDAKVSFVYEDKEPEQIVVKPVIPEIITPENEEPKFTSSDRKKDVIMLQIGKSLAVAYNKKVNIDPDNDQVVPYITNDRTLVPIRFVAETLGAEVLWEKGWDGCIIKKDETEIKLTFGSAEFTVNGEMVAFDAPIELVQDRTMVPIRFVSEQLGCDVYWNDLNKAVVISPADNPWEEKREAEITALNEMLITVSGMLP